MPTANYEERVKQTLANIQASDDIHPRNKRLLTDYKRDRTLDGLSYARLQKVFSHLKIVAEHVDQPFDDMTKDDVKSLVEWVHDRDLAESTISDYKQIIKNFWEWQHGEETSEMTDWITVGARGTSETLPEDLLTREDVRALLDGCRNPRDAAFIALLWESGARIGELIDLTVGSIEDHQHGKKLVIDGKTGARRLPLLESTPYLNDWLNKHPQPNRGAPLWCKIQQADDADPLSYNYIRQRLLERAKERAELEKPVNPHHFRHSRATYLANEFTEAQLCEWFGWVQGSDVVAKYVHLSGRDIDAAYTELHGLRSPEEDETEKTVEQCPRCEELNAPEASFCSRCGQALDIDVAAELETAVERVETTSEENLQFALKLSKAMTDDRDALESFLAEVGR
ncbi:tyrosine-type recombinase/integrase [Haladaptatus sp. DFWS20]|uniref:tyrosine-type recombinase/integrase n=1 Tax=Haladaptatus sp. DFWS20 TaxID=3403467 RepID=UPI003EBB2E44